MIEFVYFDVKFIVGVDEVGRGLLVGVVVIVVVILDLNNLIEGLVDLKKLSEKKCFVFVEEIKEKVLCWLFGWVEFEEIDEFNIFYVMMFVM